MTFASQIAIDGPAGSGKSTVAKLVASALDYLYIDTGAMYRAVALAAQRRGVALDDAVALTTLAQQVSIELQHTPEHYLVFLDGEDVSEAIRSAAVGNAASPVSAVPGVREALVAQQQRLGQNGHVVMDGRDIGTKVLPAAECKIFLTASSDERARRRHRELQAKGQQLSLGEVKADMLERDQRDSSRAHSPLRQADDAILLDTSELTIDEVVAAIIELARC